MNTNYMSRQKKYVLYFWKVLSFWAIPYLVKAYMWNRGRSQLLLRFSEIAAPLTYLTCKNVAFSFGTDQKRSFDLLKTCLGDAPVLKLFDDQLGTRIVCDASNFCIGSILE